MLSANQIKARLANALAGNESFRDLADWLSKESAAFRFEDTDLLNLADAILSPLQVYFDHLISEAKLRSELNLLLTDHVQSIALHFVMDDTHIIYEDVSIQLSKPDLRSAVNSQSHWATASFAT